MTSSTSSNASGKTPVILIFFRRWCVARVVDRIREYQSKILFLVADGGRTAEEHDRCKEIRRSVEKSIDWPCEVRTLYADKNLGCRVNIPRGISWAFTQVDRAIILEDDTVPTADFFKFCEEMLLEYAEDPRIMTISGFNSLPKHQGFRGHSYLYSGYAITCGYATWARAWRHYDPDMALWPSAKSAGLLHAHILNTAEASWWTKMFDEVYYRTCSCDPYDYQWTFACWTRNALSIQPIENLVTNIGVGPEATHTKTEGVLVLNRSTGMLTWPLIHPPVMVRSVAYDKDLGTLVWYGSPLKPLQRFRAFVVRHMPRSLRSILRGLRSSIVVPKSSSCGSDRE